MESSRIGVILGSFDPCHIGHMSLATQILNSDMVDEVVFVPSKQNPWKEKSTDFNIRVEMLASAIAEIPHASVSISETFVESNYTYDVLKHIKSLYRKKEIYIITTSETYKEIKDWYNGDKILNDYKFIFADMPINIHSIVIRNMIKEGKNPLPYITENVYDIIKRKGLYK